MAVLKALPAVLLLVHLVSALNYGGGGGGGWHEKIKSQIIVKHVPKHVPVYKPYPIPKPYPVPKPVGYLKPFAIAKPFKVPHVIPVIKHFQKPFPVIKGVPFHFPIPLPKLVKLPFQIKLPKPYVVHVPKPYAVAKKYPVAVPVHVPKPYIVPVLRPYPVGVPQKVPHIVPIIKEIPEYIKKPVPVYIEEKPMNHKGTPYIGGGLHKGNPFPAGLGKGTPFSSGGQKKGSPFPEGISGGNKGTPYISSGKGGGGGGGEIHSKGTNVHATSAASFLASHAGKLHSQTDGGYGGGFTSYGHDQGQSNIQGHGGGQGYQDYGGNLQESYAGHGSAAYGVGGGYGIGGETGTHGGYGGYDLHGLSSVGGYENSGSYGRGADTNKVNEDESAAEEHGSYDSVRAHGGHLSGSSDEFGKRPVENKEIYPPKDDSQAYIGVSVTSYNDHGGRGGGYPEISPNNNYHANSGYAQNTGEHGQDPSHSYNGYAENSQYQSQNSEATYAHQGNAGSYAQMPQVAIYQIKNGAATPINYPSPNIQVYDGYQNQNGYPSKAEGEYGNNHLGGGNYEPQTYQEGEKSSYGNYEQPNPYAYQGQDGYQGESYQENQAYSGHHSQNAGDYANQEGSYGNREGYNSQPNAYTSPESYGNQANSEVYHNEASYQVNHDASGYQNGGAYSNQEVAPGLPNYGLQAAYPVQPNGEASAHQGTGTVYVRAYDNRGDSQAVYNVPNEDKYQTQDSKLQESYSAYSTKTSSAVASTHKQEASSQQTAATSRSSNDQIVGGSGLYSTPEGGDVKGGSWQGAPVK